MYKVLWISSFLLVYCSLRLLNYDFHRRGYIAVAEHHIFKSYILPCDCKNRLCFSCVCVCRLMNSCGMTCALNGYIASQFYRSSLYCRLYVPSWSSILPPFAIEAIADFKTAVAVVDVQVKSAFAFSGFLVS